MSDVVWVDRGWAKIQSAVMEAGSSHVKVGVLGSDAQRTHPLRNDISIGEVAIINEYGSEAADVPERSHLRRTFREKRTRLIQALADAARRVVFHRASAASGLHAAGKTMAEEVKKMISSGVAPANAPATVARKGHGRTLEDTGTLEDAISHEVVRGLASSDYSEIAVSEGG